MALVQGTRFATLFAISANSNASLLKSTALAQRGNERLGSSLPIFFYSAPSHSPAVAWRRCLSARMRVATATRGYAPGARAISKGITYFEEQTQTLMVRATGRLSRERENQFPRDGPKPKKWRVNQRRSLVDACRRSASTQIRRLLRTFSCETIPLAISWAISPFSMT
jgi:hypothetical protein